MPFLAFFLAVAALPADSPPLPPAGPVVRVGHGTRDDLPDYYDYLLLKEAFARAGLTMEIVEAPFVRVLEMARTGEVDAVCNVLDTGDRPRFLAFPETKLVDYEQCFFTRKGDPFRFDGDPGTLAGETVGTVRGFSYGEEFDRLAATGRLKLVETATTAQLAMMLDSGRLAVIIENPIALAYESRPIPGFWDRAFEVRPPVGSRPAYVAFSRASPRGMAAMEAFDRALASMWADGTCDRIIREALGDAAASAVSP